MAPLCCRKPATKGRRLLCAAIDASSLPPRRQPLGSEAASLASAPPSWPGRFFWRRRSCYGGRCPGSRPEIVSRRRSASKSAYLGPCVVVVVVVVAGEAAAWAGTITDLTTGLTQRSGKPAGSMSHLPTQSAQCVDDRQSFEDPPRRPINQPPPWGIMTARTTRKPVPDRDKETRMGRGFTH